MIAPASVPQEMIVASFHHCVESPRKVRNDEGGNQVGHGDGNERRDPDQRRERRFEIHFVDIAESRFGDGGVEEVGRRAGYQHGDAHHEDPDQQLHLHDGIRYAQQNEGDQRDAGDAVGFETVGARADRIARVVAGAVGDHAGVARVVFLDLEHDLHQVGADVGDLGEDAAGDAQRRRAQRFADGESDEARPRVVARNEEQNEQHHQQFHADQHHADAHAGAQRNLINRIGLAAQPGKRRPRVGEGVHANPEPRHSVASRNSHHAEEQNDRNPHRLVVTQHAEVQHDDDGDEDPQQEEEFALRDEVRLAGFVDQLGNFAHGAVHRQVLQAHVNRQAEDQSEDAKQDAPDAAACGRRLR